MTANTKLWLAAALCVAANAPAAQADMRWKTEMKIEGTTGARVGRPVGMAPVISTTTAVKDGAQRTETSVQVGIINMSMNEVTLTLCEKKQRVRLDDKLKIYVTLPIDSEVAPQNPLAGMAASIGKMLPPGFKLPGLPQAPQGEPATGKVISTITAQDLGEDTVAETKTQRWMLTMKNENSGCAGTDTTTLKMEVWTAKIDEPVVCPDAVNRNPISEYQKALKPQCKITTEMHGEGLETFGKIFRGIVMRLKMYQGETTDKAVMTQEVTMITRAKQDDALFAVPADYKEVKAEEFDQMRSQAMIRQLMGGFGGAQ